MKCEEVTEWMQRDLDNDLNDLEKRRLDAHLGNCPLCSQMYHRLQKLSLGLEQLPKVEPAYSLVDAILPRIETLQVEHHGADSNDKVHAIRDKLQTNRWNARFWGGWVAAGIVLMIGVFTLADRGMFVMEGNSMGSTADKAEMAKIASNSASSESRGIKSEEPQRYDRASESKKEEASQENGIAVAGESNDSSKQFDAKGKEGSALTKEQANESEKSMTFTTAGTNGAQTDAARLPSPDGQWVGALRDQTVYIENIQGEVAYSSTQLRKTSDQLSLKRWSEDGKTLYYEVVDEMGQTTEWEIQVDVWTERKVSP
jgi:hypothetical protein